MILGLVPAAQAASPRRPVVTGMLSIADLSVTKNSPFNANAGTDVPFDVTIFNGGPNAALTVSLTDPLPAGMTFVSEIQNNGPAFSCTNPTAGANGTITCTIATLPAGASANFTFVAHIPPATPPGTTFTNIATASAIGSLDPTPENDSGATAVTVPIPQADVSVGKSGPSKAAPNSDVVFTITVANGGPTTASTVSLNDTLPGKMTFVSLTQSGPFFTCSTPTVGSGGTVTCSIASLVAGALTTFTLTGHIPNGTASGTPFTNIATVSSTTSDPNPDNNTSQAGFTVSAADVGVTKSGPATAIAGGQISWTVTASNAGPDAALGVALSDALPAGTTFVSVVQVNGPASSCSGPPIGFNGTVTCTFGTLAIGASAQFTITATIDPSFSGNLSNTATINAATGDPNSANNSATANTTVSASADLTINKSGTATATAGTNITYTVTLTNSGPSTAASVSLTDAVPANTTFVSEAQTAGSTFSCATPASGGTGNVTCTIGSFAVGGSATFSITVHISPGAAGTTITNTATATTSSTDTNPANNTSTATTTVTRSADISVVKTAVAGAVAGSNLTYNITVTNNGPSDAAAVTMNDTLPPNTTFVSESQTSGPAFICTNPSVGGTGTVSCSIAALNCTASATFAIVVQVALAAPVGPSSNTATVTSTADPNAGNNSSTAVTQIGAALADLSITKTPAAGPYGTGLPLTYTLVVTNSGPNAGSGVVVTDILPGGATLQSSTPSGACSGTTTITCNAGTLASGATTTFTLTVTLPTTPGAITNTATVSASVVNPDPNPANNTASSTITVIPAANIPAISPLALLLLCIALAAAGAIVLRQ